MAYITNANFRRITKEFEVPKDKDFKFDDIVIWESPKGTVVDKDHPYIFGWWEVNRLLAFKEFCKNTNLAVKHFYRKIEKPQDSFKYIDAEKSPAYHCDINCEAMHSSLRRIEIPQSIREQGKEKVMEFRTWWKDNESLCDSKPDAFVAKLNLVFHTDLRNYDVEDRGNSGVHELDDNRSIEEIDCNIRDLFNGLYAWAKEDRNRREIFRNFKSMSFLGNSENSINADLGDYSEEEVKEVLKHVHSIKEEITEDLQKLYQRRYIPDLDFQTSLLESLGFVPCYICMGGVNKAKIIE
jgi:hypothetical protein